MLTHVSFHLLCPQLISGSIGVIESLMKFASSTNISTFITTPISRSQPFKHVSFFVGFVFTTFSGVPSQPDITCAHPPQPTAYFHPLDNLFVNWYPPHFALWLFGLHVWDYWVFMIGAVLLGLDDHGGYAFPFSPFRLFPGQPSAEWHLFHHFGSGNYSKDFWDGTFKTDREYKKFLEQREKIREVSKED